MNKTQRRYYDALPAEDRDGYLKDLATSPAALRLQEKTQRRSRRARNRGQK